MRQNLPKLSNSAPDFKASNLLYGAVAGLTGSALMHAFRICWELATRHHSRHAIFGFDCEADVRSARLLLAWTPDNISEETAARVGLALHYVYGTALGCLYASVRNPKGWFSKMSGLPVGTALWLCADEIPIAVSGVSNPFRKSSFSHGGALAANVLFAVALEDVIRAFGCRHASPAILKD